MNTIIFRILFGFIVPILVILVGVLFISISRKVPEQRRWKETHCTEITRGIVVRLEKEAIWEYRNKGREYYVWIPYVKYQVGGYDYEEPLNGHGETFFQINEVLDVHYNPLNPAEIYVDKDTGEQIVGKAYYPMGIGLCVFGVLFSLCVNGLAFLI